MMKEKRQHLVFDVDHQSLHTAGSHRINDSQVLISINKSIIVQI